VLGQTNSASTVIAGYMIGKLGDEGEEDTHQAAAALSTSLIWTVFPMSLAFVLIINIIMGEKHGAIVKKLREIEEYKKK